MTRWIDSEEAIFSIIKTPELATVYQNYLDNWKPEIQSYKPLINSYLRPRCDNKIPYTWKQFLSIKLSIISVHIERKDYPIPNEVGFEHYKELEILYKELK